MNNIDNANIVVHRASSRGYNNFGWLKTFHTFSFSNYFNPERMHFGKLRVLNDDRVEGGTGFDLHPHENMEIITIPLSGTLLHTDSFGHEQEIKPGEVQIMSAGTGLYHSEYNGSETEPVTLLQIWVLPKIMNVKPRYDQKAFNHIDKLNKFQTIVSPNEKDGSLFINQDAYFHLAELDESLEINYKLENSKSGVYLFIIEGRVQTSNEVLNRRDAIGISGMDEINIKAIEKSEILLIEVPMN
jgi:quercetin 2,3-dioxygenase